MTVVADDRAAAVMQAKTLQVDTVRLLPDEPLATHDKAGVPMYRGIIQGATVLRIVSLLLWVGGAVVIIQGLMYIASGREESRAVGLGGIVAGLCSFAGAAILHMLAQLGLAMRDLTRNSFRKS